MSEDRAGDGRPESAICIPGSAPECAAITPCHAPSKRRSGAVAKQTIAPNASLSRARCRDQTTPLCGHCCRCTRVEGTTGGFSVDARSIIATARSGHLVQETQPVPQLLLLGQRQLTSRARTDLVDQHRERGHPLISVISHIPTPLSVTHYTWRPHQAGGTHPTS